MHVANGGRVPARSGAPRIGFRVAIALGCVVAVVAGVFTGVSGAATKDSLTGRSYVPGEVLVRFRDGASAAGMTQAHSAVAGTVARSFHSVPNLQHVRLGAGVDVNAALAAYRARADVLYAEPNRIYRIDDADLTPNDPQYPSMYNLNNTGQTGGTVDADIDAPEAWDTGTGSNQVYVGVLDTGIDWDHPDIAANNNPNALECGGQAGQDDDGNEYVDDCHGIDPRGPDTNPMDVHGHGTHTSGTIGAVGNNNTGVTGVNWDVEIIACRTHDAAGNGTEAALLECLQYMEDMKAQGYNVVTTSNSYGGCPEACGFSQALMDAIESNMQEEILFVASAGNSASNNDNALVYPASYFLPNVIAVAATDDDDLLASFSNYGSRTVHVAAPGVSVLSTFWNNTYATLSGTSMSAPHVAGIAALLAASDSSLNWKEIRNRIMAGGDPKPSVATKTITGNRANANGALTCSRRKEFGVLRPLPTNVDGTEPITIAALNVNCERPGRALEVKVQQTGETIQLADDGQGPDLASRDGIFSGTWNLSPCSAGQYTLKFSNRQTATVQIVC